jgi:hypothetical protein
MYKLATRSYSQKYQRGLQFCTIYLAFKRGCYEAVLDSKQPLGVYLNGVNQSFFCMHESI